MSERAAVSVAGLMLVTIVLTGCGPDARGMAEESMAGMVDPSVDAMVSALRDASLGPDLDPADFEVVATNEFLTRLSDLPTEAPAATTYCLEREGMVITACVFYPVVKSISAGISVYQSNIYGCAELSGRPGDREIVVRDTECPEELVEWMLESPSVSYEPVKEVSIAAITDHRFDE